jgi:hypothetical protein
MVPGGAISGSVDKCSIIMLLVRLPTLSLLLQMLLTAMLPTCYASKSQDFFRAEAVFTTLNFL